MKILFLLCYFTLSIGQVLTAREMPVDTLRVLQVSQEQGLSQLGATSLQFDKQGFLWVGTQNGLNRFNGYHMKVWRADERNKGFPNDFIRAMHYENDTLWMTTHTNALCAYLLAEDRFIHFSDQLDFENNPSLKHSLALHVASNGALIIGTAGHCLLFDRKQFKYEVLQIPQLLENDFVTCIEAIDDNHYLIGTNASGLYVLNLHKKSLFVVDNLTRLQRAQINVVYRQEDGRLYIGTGEGLYRLDPTTQKLSLLDKRVIRSVNRWDDHTLLLGGTHESYFLENDKNWRKVVYIDHHGQEIVADILAYQEDSQGGKWLGTESRGIFYYHPYQTKFVPQRVHASNAPKADFISIFNFLRDGDDLWIATEFGFARRRLGHDAYKLYRTNYVGYTLAKDSSGTIWLGGYDQGLLRYNKTKDELEPIAFPSVDRDVVQITPISADSIWIHTLADGIYAMHTQSLQAQPVRFSDEPIRGARAGFVDSKANVWVGSESGLYRVTKDRRVIHYDSLSNERVFAIAEDQEGYIWIGTSKGLNQLNPVNGELTHYRAQTGLPNDFIYSVEVDGNGNIWVSTNYGVSVLNRKSGAFKNYTQDDGLQNNEFNGKAGYRDSLGYLYFGGMNGYNIFHPDSIRINRHSGRTHVENVLLFGRPISENVLYTDTLVFSHDQNVITFEFVNLNYLWSKKNRYQFILVGFDKEWRPITAEHSTTYTNLPPGTYRFMVRGSNNELIWGDIEEITVIIQSPWYDTTAFRAGMGVLLLLLVGGGVTYKAYQQRKLNQRLQMMVNERTEELSQTNTALHQSLEVTQMQKENISFLMQELNHRVKNNLQLITSLIDIQSFEIDDKDIQDKLLILQSRVFTVSKIHDLLNVNQEDSKGSSAVFIANLTSDLIAFSGLDIVFRPDLENVTLPSNKLSYLGLILNELITNSIKHAFTTEQMDKVIQVILRKKDDILLLEYRDNGVGFDKDRVWGNQHQGMNLIYLLVKELGGSVHVETDQGVGFVMQLPYKT